MIYELVCVHAKNALLIYTCGRGINLNFATSIFLPVRAGKGLIWLIENKFAFN